MTVVVKELTSFKFLLTLVLFVGLFQVAGYRTAGILASNDGSMPIPQPDTLLYCQAARRIAEGHPFSYSAGEKVSTGTTSVAYPFALALPYAAGARGSMLLTAGFWLNALFYLVFLCGWAIAFWHWTERPSLRLLSGACLALLGQPAYCALSQSDTGMMMSVAAVFAAGLALERPLVWGTALVLSPWVRPEGMMCVAGVAATLFAQAFLSRRSLAKKPRRFAWAVVFLSAVSAAGVFALNYAMTGEAQFSSVAEKGYFKNFPFFSALSMGFNDACEIARAYFCGLVDGGFRNTIALPLLGGLMFMWGLMRYWSFPQKGAGARMAPLAFAAVLSLATVATSGWQGTNFDRYLAWFQPLLVFFVSAGALELGGLAGGTARWIAPGLLLAFYGVASVSSMAQFHSSAKIWDPIQAFGRAVDQLTPPDATVGGVTCGTAYFLENRRFLHLAGLYSPDFQIAGRQDAAARMEMFRHEPSLRPDYLILRKPDDFFQFTPEQLDKMGTQLLMGPCGMELRQCRWTLCDASLVQSLMPTGRTLVAQVDVGYERDERASAFEIADRWNRRPGAPFIHIGRLNGTEMIDCGRGVEGMASMSVPLVPGRDATIVVRSVRSETVRYRGEFTTEKIDLKMDGHVGFEVLVDGERAAHIHTELPAGADGDFVEFALTIPGRKIGRSNCRVTIDGDHLVCGYRFYQ